MRCCFLRDRLISRPSLRLITSRSETRRAGDLDPVPEDFLGLGVGEQPLAEKPHSSTAGLLEVASARPCGPLPRDSIGL